MQEKNKDYRSFAKEVKEMSETGKNPVKIAKELGLKIAEVNALISGASEIEELYFEGIKYLSPEKFMKEYGLFFGTQTKASLRNIYYLSKKNKTKIPKIRAIANPKESRMRLYAPSQEILDICKKILKEFTHVLI